MVRLETRQSPKKVKITKVSSAEKSTVTQLPFTYPEPFFVRGGAGCTQARVSTTRCGYINANDVKAFFILGIICGAISFTTSSALMYSSAKRRSNQSLLYYYYDYRYGSPLLFTWLRFYCAIGYMG